MLFISTSGPLGRYISLPPPITIWFRSLIAILCLIIYALLKKTSFKIWGTGKPTREFMHVQDLVDASFKILKISKIISKSLKNGGTIFWCGNGGSASTASHFSVDLSVALSTGNSSIFLCLVISSVL